MEQTQRGETRRQERVPRKDRDHSRCEGEGGAEGATRGGANLEDLIQGGLREEVNGGLDLVKRPGVLGHLVT